MTRTSDPTPRSLPVSAASPLVEPSTLRCIRCQLFGRRSSLCFRVAACNELPRVFPLAPVLLVAWAPY